MRWQETADRIVRQAKDYGFQGISAFIQNEIADAVKAEREWCAKIADSFDGVEFCAYEIAEKIRQGESNDLSR